jgi:hypothetical protein
VQACGRMTKLTKSSDESGHQTVTEFIKLQTLEETIQIGFTDQKVSGRAGLLTCGQQRRDGPNQASKQVSPWGLGPVQWHLP